MTIRKTILTMLAIASAIAAHEPGVQRAVAGGAGSHAPLWFQCQSGDYASRSVKTARLRACRVAGDSDVQNTSATAAVDELPVNPAVTQDNIGETICMPGWTKTVRPPVSYTNRVKIDERRAMGLPLELIGDFKLDHVIPLSLGGAPADRRNLRLEDADEAEQKDEVERCLPRAVCEGRVPLAVAQRAIWADWRAARALCGH